MSTTRTETVSFDSPWVTGKFDPDSTQTDYRIVVTSY